MVFSHLVLAIELFAPAAHHIAVLKLIRRRPVKLRNYNLRNNVLVSFARSRSRPKRNGERREWKATVRSEPL